VPQGYPVSGYPAPYGYPAAPAFPMAPRGPRRPGTVTAAAILAYVVAGLLILAGLGLLFGASAARDIDNAVGSDNTTPTAEMALIGLLNLVAGGLLIAGPSMYIFGNPRGRLMLRIGAGICVPEAFYWVIRLGFKPYTGNQVLVWALVFTAPAIIALSLTFSGTANNWLKQREQLPG